MRQKHQHVGNIGGAVSDFRQALGIDPMHYIAQKHLGLALMREGKIDESLSALLKAHREYASNTDIYAPLGQCYLKQQNWQAAAKSFQQAIASGSNLSSGVYFSLGVALQNLGQYEESQAAYEQVIRRAPTNEPAKKQLAQLRQ